MDQTAKNQMAENQLPSRASSPPINQSQQSGEEFLVHNSKIETCMVCADDMIMTSDDIYFLQCFHRFHISCISRWLTVKPQCPVCKFPANIDIIDVDEHGTFKSASGHLITNGIIENQYEHKHAPESLDTRIGRAIDLLREIHTNINVRMPPQLLRRNIRRYEHNDEYISQEESQREESDSEDDIQNERQIRRRINIPQLRIMPTDDTESDSEISYDTENNQVESHNELESHNEVESDQVNSRWVNNIWADDNFTEAISLLTGLQNRSRLLNLGAEPVSPDLQNTDAESIQPLNENALPQLETSSQSISALPQLEDGFRLDQDVTSTAWWIQEWPLQSTTEISSEINYGINNGYTILPDQLTLSDDIIVSPNRVAPDTTVLPQDELNTTTPSNSDITMSDIALSPDDNILSDID